MRRSPGIAFAAAVLVLASCSGDKAASDLAVGDCFDDPDAETFTEVKTVDCTEEHDNEVFHVFDLEDGDYPGDDEVGTLGHEGCKASFEDFIGVPWEESELEILPITPTQDSWDDDDDREVACTVFDPGGPVEGSLEGSEE
jgi:hypothetical protein